MVYVDGLSYTYMVYENEKLVYLYCIRMCENVLLVHLLIHFRNKHCRRKPNAIGESHIAYANKIRLTARSHWRLLFPNKLY